jgi:hypothetical protein
VAVVEPVAAPTGRARAVRGDGRRRRIRQAVDRSDAPVQASFEYAGAEVTATSDGALSVRFPGDDAV